MEEHKQTLIKANEAIRKNDHEGFLKYCTEDTKWTFVGDTILNGKEAVRQWMKQNYLEAPTFTVTDLIEENNHVVALGTITSSDHNGQLIESLYADVWRFENGKMAELKAFVLNREEED